ncbi:MAG TPA: flagellar biosynthetic protein FliO [Woeseiaceae bacterium]|nr:flagellar biosynthetic protein FliO [Woeseiaceae bacterium]
MIVSPTEGSELLSVAASLLVVVGSIVVLGWLYSRSKFVGAGNSDAISIVASRALGAKERLMLIEVADKQLLIGMTQTQVQTLHVFDAPVLSHKAPLAETNSGFAQRFKAALQEKLR